MAIIRGVLGKMGEGLYVCMTEGRTFQYKEELKALGFTWDAEGEVWIRGCISEAEKTKLEVLKKERWFGLFLKFERESWRPK